MRIMPEAYDTEEETNRIDRNYNIKFSPLKFRKRKFENFKFVESVNWKARSENFRRNVYCYLYQQYKGYVEKTDSKFVKNFDLVREGQFPKRFMISQEEILWCDRLPRVDIGYLEKVKFFVDEKNEEIVKENGDFEEESLGRRRAKPGSGTTTRDNSWGKNDEEGDDFLTFQWKILKEQNFEKHKGKIENFGNRAKEVKRLRIHEPFQDFDKSLRNKVTNPLFNGCRLWSTNYGKRSTKN
jgi:hypothetical protein